MALMEKFMPEEPLYVSARFRNIVEATIHELERDAAADEQMLGALTSPDHRRRQQRLVRAQLDRAFSLREMLALSVLRAA